jgi:hypothetical protein
LLDRVVGYMKAHGVAAGVRVNAPGASGERIALTETWAQMYAQAAAMAKGAVSGS